MNNETATEALKRMIKELFAKCNTADAIETLLQVGIKTLAEDTSKDKRSVADTGIILILHSSISVMVETLVKSDFNVTALVKKRVNEDLKKFIKFTEEE